MSEGRGWLTVLTHEDERKTVLGKDLLLLNLGTPRNFSGLTGAQQCLWSPGDPVKVWVLTVLSQAGLRLHTSNEVLLDLLLLLAQGPHCTTTGRVGEAHWWVLLSVSQLSGLGCSWHWDFHLFL